MAFQSCWPAVPMELPSGVGRTSRRAWPRHLDPWQSFGPDAFSYLAPRDSPELALEYSDGQQDRTYRLALPSLTTDEAR
jgi:hypothetical protein